MRHSYGARLDKLQIRPLSGTDIELLRQWRNDELISKYLRKISYISSKQQNEWYKTYLSQPGIYYWSIAKENRIIGALAIYNIDNQTAEIGKIMIGDIMDRGKGYGCQSFLMAMKIGFELLSLQTFRLNVHEKNSVAINSYKRVGFTITGSHPFNENGCEYEMELAKDRFMEINPIIKNIVVYSANGGLYPIFNER